MPRAERISSIPATNQSAVDCHSIRNKVAQGAPQQGSADDLLLCPITEQPFVDPVMTCDGQTYERYAIQRWFDGGHATSPLTGLPLENLTLIPNLAMKRDVANAERSWLSSLEQDIPLHILLSHEAKSASLFAALLMQPDWQAWLAQAVSVTVSDVNANMDTLHRLIDSDTPLRTCVLQIALNSLEQANVSHDQWTALALRKADSTTAHSLRSIYLEYLSGVAARLLIPVLGFALQNNILRAAIDDEDTASLFLRLLPILVPP